METNIALNENNIQAFLQNLGNYSNALGKSRLSNKLLVEGVQGIQIEAQFQDNFKITSFKYGEEDYLRNDDGFYWCFGETNSLITLLKESGLNKTTKIYEISDGTTNYMIGDKVTYKYGDKTFIRTIRRIGVYTDEFMASENIEVTEVTRVANGGKLILFFDYEAGHVDSKGYVVVSNKLSKLRSLGMTFDKREIFEDESYNYYNTETAVSYNDYKHGIFLQTPAFKLSKPHEWVVFADRNEMAKYVAERQPFFSIAQVEAKIKEFAAASIHLNQDIFEVLMKRFREDYEKPV